MLDKSGIMCIIIFMINSNQNGTDKLLSPSMMHRLSDSEDTRKVIPFEDRTRAMADLAVATSHDLPAIGEPATLQFSDGHTQSLDVTGYTKSDVQVAIPSGGGVVNSNVDLASFERLTRETRTQPKQ